MGLFLFFFFWYDINTVKDRELTKPPAKTANNTLSRMHTARWMFIQQSTKRHRSALRIVGNVELLCMFYLITSVCIRLFAAAKPIFTHDLERKFLP